MRIYPESGTNKPSRTDLSGSCNEGSLFMKQVFGSTIRGHYQHQDHVINGRTVSG
ncbi:MAG: hypothetical protein ACOYM1_06885 [Methylovulum sp.]